MDVKSAFLNGLLEEEVYVEQPPGFEIQDGESILLVQIYVDDIIFGSTNKELCDKFSNLMQEKFEMSMIGELTFFLGLQVKHLKDGTFISQTKYTRDLMKKFGMEEKSSVKIPMNTSAKMDMDAYGKPVVQTRYIALIGSLLYLTASKPNITFVVGMVSRYQSNPGPAHWAAVKRILRYLKGTKGLSLCYHGGSLKLVGYSDADGSADRDERKSTSGYAFLLGGAVITWCSKKQPCIALSTMEAEYIACTSAVQEAIWLRRFLQSLRITAHVDDAVVVYCDNTSALAYAKDPKYHGRTKHIDTRYHCIRESVAQGQTVLRYIPTSDMVADPSTKPLHRDVFQRHVKSMGLCRI
ncbi:hypothetical protein DH2020_048255 [Rehmannia glutinosa]|uniref:Reverse transcriptase Ty1/copia-type domain-containing protein n=1 Tax=Rehmannia glutinosa TaxID=99300 RepID=A0ABR0U7A8_REHGL